MQNRPLEYARVSTTGQTLEAQLDEFAGPFVESITFHEPVPAAGAGRARPAAARRETDHCEVISDFRITR
jgi:hypothetical protein